MKSKVFEGNSTGIMFPMLTPRTLRALITLYEHEIFTQGYQFVWSVRHICTLGVLYWAAALFENRSNGCQIRKGTCKEHLDTIERARGCEGPRQLRTSFFFSQVDTVELLTVHNVPMHNSHSAWNLGSAQVGRQRIMQIHAYRIINDHFHPNMHYHIQNITRFSCIIFCKEHPDRQSRCETPVLLLRFPCSLKVAPLGPSINASLDSVMHPTNLDSPNSKQLQTRVIQRAQQKALKLDNVQILLYMTGLQCLLTLIPTRSISPGA